MTKGSHSESSHSGRPGVILPVWSTASLKDGDITMVKCFQALSYILALMYLLLGISIITNRLVLAMEVIANQKRMKTVRFQNGTVKCVKVHVWHPVVVSLTVFSIGCAAPEIFLSLFEMFECHFEISDIGPSLIVGSAAYYLLIIIGVCILSGDETYGKPIQDRAVFFTQTICAILSYFWIYVIIGIISPGVIEPWEAAVTMFYFPTIVILIWCVSKRHLNSAFNRLRFILGKNSSSSSSVTPSELTSLMHGQKDFENQQENDEDEEAVADEEKKRRAIGKIFRQLKAKYPEKPQSELEEMAQNQMIEDTPKTAAFYRLQISNVFGGERDASKKKIKEKLEDEKLRAEATQKIGFTSAHYICNENCGSVNLTVERSGLDIVRTRLTIRYGTQECTAKAYYNFMPATAEVMFDLGVKSVNISIRIVDDGVYGAKAGTFRVTLYDADLEKVRDGDNTSMTYLDSSLVALIQPVAVISIVDSDHCGEFGFETADMVIPDNIGTAKIKVIRQVGSHDYVKVPYRIIPGTAKETHDYVVPSTKGVLYFVEGQLQDFIDVKIIDRNRIGEVFTFFIELGRPKSENQHASTTVALPDLGENRVVQIGICENEETKEALDRLVNLPDLQDYAMTTTWKDQIAEAFTIPCDFGCTKSAKVKAFMFHIISFPWKLLVALFPPPQKWQGWVAFLSLLGLMAFVAALVCDCTTYLGSTIGLKDSITAMTFIAIGIGLPDTFASRHAAMYEKTADTAIGHITGGNIASVFLGIGFTWTVASTYQASQGATLKVKNSGDLGFSVTLFCTFAAVTVILLIFRRLPPCNGELGGPTYLKVVSAVILFSLWILFIGLSILRDMKYI